MTSAGHEPDEPKTLADAIQTKIEATQAEGAGDDKPRTLADSIRKKVEAQNSAGDKQQVKHDWTFFFFIAIAFILVASAIAWTSIKTGPYDTTDNEPVTYGDKAH